MGGAYRGAPTAAEAIWLLEAGGGRVGARWRVPGAAGRARKGGDAVPRRAQLPRGEWAIRGGDEGGRGARRWPHPNGRTRHAARDRERCHAHRIIRYRGWARWGRRGGGGGNTPPVRWVGGGSLSPALGPQPSDPRRYDTSKTLGDTIGSLFRCCGKHTVRRRRSILRCIREESAWGGAACQNRFLRRPAPPGCAAAPPACACACAARCAAFGDDCPDIACCSASTPACAHNRSPSSFP